MSKKIFAKEFRGTPMRAITLKDISQNKNIQILQGEGVNNLNEEDLSFWMKQAPWTEEAKKDFFKITNINLNKDTFNFIYIKKNKIQFINTFDFTSAEDLIYYILFCMEQLELNPEKIA